MGEARRRGSFEERKAQAIKADRSLVKTRLLRNIVRHRQLEAKYKAAIMMAMLLSGQGRRL